MRTRKNDQEQKSTEMLGAHNTNTLESEPHRPKKAKNTQMRHVLARDQRYDENMQRDVHVGLQKFK